MIECSKIELQILALFLKKNLQKDFANDDLEISVQGHGWNISLRRTATKTVVVQPPLSYRVIGQKTWHTWDLA